MKFRHLGIFVFDMTLMVDFYTRVLGFPITDRGRMQVPDSEPPREQELVFLSNDPTEHHQIILVEGRPPDLPFNPVNQISFLLEGLSELRDLAHLAQGEGVQEIRPVTHGNAWSVYLRDPEGNRLEFYVNTPWYIDQPFREPLDLDQSDEAIFDETLKMCQSSPGFKSREAWIEEMRALMK